MQTINDLTDEIEQCAADNDRLIVAIECQREKDPANAKEYNELIAELEMANRNLLRKPIQ